MQVSDFEFDLPRHLIARYPAPNRSDSRLLHLHAATGDVQHLVFRDLPGLLHADDLMVFNNTRVIAARFFGRKETGGRVEILLERLLGVDEALARIRAGKSPKAGARITLAGGGPLLTVLARQDEFYRLRFPAPGVAAIASRHGHVPLPPYLERADEPLDAERYQTVFAKADGAVAAPTAGLHFDQALLERLDARGIARAELTLHIGSGTFQPVRVARVEEHRMHAEFAEVPVSVCRAIESCRARRGRVVAVGTTSVRSLESAAAHGGIAPWRGDTDIFIYPGYEFRCVDAMVTNFHLPGSTLLMLVSAFAGIDNIRRAYAQAIAASYRFFSYGDAMLITR